LAALLSRDLDDELRVKRSDSTAKYLHWGGALMGGPVLMFAPATGAELLSVSGLAGVGAIIGHFRENADPVALAVNRRAVDVTVLLQRATTATTVDMLWGDLDEELCQDSVRPQSEATLSAG
jgi:hypothetical protein